MLTRIISEREPQSRQIFAICLGALAWTAIGLQFYITDLSAINFFSYFTTLSNLLVAVCLSFTVWNAGKSGRFFSSLSVQSAVAVYISIVSLVYNLALRGIWMLTGLGWVLDNMVHVVVPVMYVLYWIFFRPGGRLEWQQVMTWMLFPFLYLSYSLVRGAMTNWYPYPFLNANKFGYEQVFINIALMLIVFMISGLLLILISRISDKK